MKIRKETLGWAVTFVLLLSVGFTGFAQDDPAVIQIGEYTETLSTFNERFDVAIRGVAASQGMPVNEQTRAQFDALKPQFLERRVTELVLLNEAGQRGIEVTEEELDARIEEARASIPEGATFDDLLAQAGFEDEAQLRLFLGESETIQKLIEDLRSGIEVTDDQLQTAYEANEQQYQRPEQVCARHILLESVEDAEAALTDLEGGADFAELAAERSTGPSGPNGGDLGCFGRGQMVGPFEEAAFAAETDTPVGPVETQFGQHVILVYEKREAGMVPLEEVREQLTEQLQDERLGEVIEALTEAAAVQTFPENLGIEASAPAEEAPDESAEMEGGESESDAPAGEGGADEAQEDTGDETGEDGDGQ